MRSTLLRLWKSARCAVIGVAVLAVLATSLRLHLHAPHVDGHGHLHTAEVGCGGLDLNHDCTPDDGDDPASDESDECRHCHCPAPAIVAPDDTRIPSRGPGAPVEALLLLSRLPDSRSYPPDPPPERAV